jgi:hypothetical protein
LYGLEPYQGTVPLREPLLLEFPNSGRVTNSVLFYTLLWIQDFASRCWIQGAAFIHSCVVQNAFAWPKGRYADVLDNTLPMTETIKMLYHSVRLLENVTKDLLRVHLDLPEDFDRTRLVKLVFSPEWNQLQKLANALLVQLLMICSEQCQALPIDQKIATAYASGFLLNEVRVAAEKRSLKETTANFPFIDDISKLAIGISHLWLARKFSTQQFHLQAGYIWSCSKELRAIADNDTNLETECQECIEKYEYVSKYGATFDPKTDPLDTLFLEDAMPQTKMKDEPRNDLSRAGWYEAFPDLPLLRKADFYINPETDLWKCVFAYGTNTGLTAAVDAPLELPSAPTTQPVSTTRKHHKHRTERAQYLAYA